MNVPRKRRYPRTPINTPLVLAADGRTRLPSLGTLHVNKGDIVVLSGMGGGGGSGRRSGHLGGGGTAYVPLTSGAGGSLAGLTITPR